MRFHQWEKPCDCFLAGRFLFAGALLRGAGFLLVAMISSRILLSGFLIVAA